MGLHDLFDDASRVMTVISFATFLGILAWTFAFNREKDFAASAALPFADDARDDLRNDPRNGGEGGHV